MGSSGIVHCGQQEHTHTHTHTYMKMLSVKLTWVFKCLGTLSSRNSYGEQSGRVDVAQTPL